MRKIVQFIFASLFAILSNISVIAQCTTGSAGTICPPTSVTWANHGSLGATTQWKSILVTSTGFHEWFFSDSLNQTNPRVGAFFEVYTCGSQNYELVLNWNTSAYHYHDINNFSCNGNVNNEYLSFPANTGTNYKLHVSIDSCTGTTDSFRLYYRMMCKSNDLGTYGDSIWIGHVYNENNTIGALEEYMGSYGTESFADFDHDFGTTQPPTTTGNCFMCFDSAHIDKDTFTVRYRANYLLSDRSFYKITCADRNLMSVSHATQTFWDYSTLSQSKQVPVKTSTFIIAPSGSWSNGLWGYSTFKDTGSLKADFHLCKMTGDNTNGTNMWNAYVYDSTTSSSSVRTSQYQGTFTVNNLFFHYDWGTGQPTMTGDRCSQTMDNDYFHVGYRMKYNFPAGRYKFKVKGSDGVGLSLRQNNASETVKAWIVSQFSSGAKDVTSSFYSLSGDTVVYLEYVEMTGNANISYLHCREPKNPGEIFASLDTVCTSGDSVWLRADTIDGSHTQWYRSACGTGTYLGSGDSIRVRIDSITTYYVRNRNLCISQDGSDTLDLYSQSCASKTIRIRTTPYAIINPPLNQAVCSDTPYTFVFYGLTAGCGGNQIEWALNSSFAGSTIASSPDILYITVDTADTDTVYFRSRNSISGSTSSSAYVSAGNYLPPGAPIPPSNQSVCSDTNFVFLFSGVSPGLGGDSIEWALDENFALFTIVTDSFETLLEPQTSDTIWLRTKNTITGCVSPSVYCIAKNNLKPLPPLLPIPQTIMSDTPYTFILDSISLLYGGNLIYWTLDSSFSSYSQDTSNFSMSLTVHPDTLSVVWFKSVDTLSGCLSDASLLPLIVEGSFFEEVAIDTTISVCLGFGTYITLSSSQASKLYYLINENMPVDSAYGNGSNLSLYTGIIDSNCLITITFIDTSTAVQTQLDTLILIIPIEAVDTPIFIEQAILVNPGDTIQYNAVANNSQTFIFQIVYGGAQVDSMTGLVTNITDSFTIRAIGIGLSGCGSAFADLHIDTTSLLAPDIPEEVYGIADSTDSQTFVIDSIYATGNADRIEWSLDESFKTSNIETSPAAISIELKPGESQFVYVRSRHSSSGRYSRTNKMDIINDTKLLSSGLIDKSGFELNNQLSDEFSYTNSPNPALEVVFNSKWALNHCWGADCDPLCITNHTMQDVSGAPIGNTWLNTQNNGSGLEVELDLSGHVSIKLQKLLTPIAPTLSQYTNTACSTAPYSSFTADFSEGLIISKNFVECDYPRIVEIKWKIDSKIGTWPAFWMLGLATEFDIYENDIDDLDELNRVTSNVHDYWDETSEEFPAADGFNNSGLTVSCQQWSWKNTLCNYAEDWHTFSLYVTDNKVIYFIDGKEFWSKADNGFPRNVPDNLGLEPDDEWLYPNPMRMLITTGLANLGPFDPDDFDDYYETVIDYVRVYDLIPNYYNGSGCLKNVDAYGMAQTLESPNYFGASQNNNRIILGGNAATSTQSILHTMNLCAETPNGTNPRVFYGSLPYQCSNAYSDGTNWYEYQLKHLNQVNVNDVYSDVVNHKNFVYYRTFSSFLKYFYWNPTAQAWMNLYAAPNCKGGINVDDLGRVFYIGTDNNVYMWAPTNQYSGTVYKITNSNDVKDGLTVGKCGCILFYRDNSYNVKQWYWWNSWQPVSGSIINTGNVVPSLALDEKHELLYILSSDNSIYSYNYKYSSLTSMIKKLGYESCGNNAIGYLTLNSSGDALYYIGKEQDQSKVWYYHNDKHRGSVLTGSWNRTILNHRQSYGPIEVDPIKDRLYYVGLNRKLYFVDWAAGDYELACPYDHDNYDLAASKTDGLDEATNSSITEADSTVKNELKVKVFPNPSSGIFTFDIANVSENDAITISINDINGKVLYNSTSMSVGTNLKFEWNSNIIGSGFYLYKVRVNDKQYCGKLMKL